MECIHCGIGKFKIDSVDQNQPEQQEEITAEVGQLLIVAATLANHKKLLNFYILSSYLILLSKLLIGLAIGVAASMIGTCIYLNYRKKKNALKSTDVDVDLDLSQPVYH